MYCCRCARRKNFQSGFALITSLVFLVVVTLLALSGMRSVGLQEKMASNLREKGRAFNAANTALRGSEYDISLWTDPPDPPDPSVSGSHLWKLDGPSQTSGQPTDFADDAVWLKAWTYTQPPYSNGNNGLTSKPEAFIEQDCYAPMTGGLNPTELSKATDAIVETYRVTGRGNGGNASAVAVVQSMYAQPYYQTSTTLTQTNRCDTGS